MKAARTKSRPPFLSIDLDYWVEQEFELAKPFLENALAAARASKVKISAIISHELILEHCKEAKTDRFINIDYHSDFVYFNDWEDTLAKRRTDGECELNCGTWAQHINRRNRGAFYWYHPNEHCFRSLGRCDPDSRAKLFDRKGDTRFVCGWNKLRHRVGLPVIPKRIAGLCICLSPDWIPRAEEKPVFDWFIAFSRDKDVVLDRRAGEASAGYAADILL